MTQLRSVTCHMGSHSVSCYPTQVNAPRLNPAMQAGTRFTYPGGMEGWVDLDLIAPRPGVERISQGRIIFGSETDLISLLIWLIFLLLLLLLGWCSSKNLRL